MRISDWSSDVCSSDLAGADRIIARVGRVFGVEHDPHRHALYDLVEISGRVLRWQDRESLPCPALHRIDMPPDSDIGKGVDLDRTRLADAHQSELRLLEIGGTDRKSVE